ILTEYRPYLPHMLCALILLGRLGDLLSTWLVTPNLVLEANPVVRRLGFRFMLFTTPICLVPYLDVLLGAALVPPFLLVSSSNFSKVWIARAMGESGLLVQHREYTRRSSLGKALLSLLAACSFIWILGLAMMLLGEARSL